MIPSATAAMLSMIQGVPLSDSLVYRVGKCDPSETRGIRGAQTSLFGVGDTAALNELIESERYLRDQTYLADASSRAGTMDEASSAFTRATTGRSRFPFHREPGDHIYYGNRHPGKCSWASEQTVGAYYGHNEFRDMYSLLPEQQFLARHNDIKVIEAKIPMVTRAALNMIIRTSRGRKISGRIRSRV